MIRLLALGVALAACTPQLVTWDETGVATIDEAPVGYRAPDLPGLCHDSFAWAHDPGTGMVYGAWWHVRPDSTADLMVARQDRAGGWSVPERADTMDAGRTGCRRAAPSMAVSNGSAYLAYGMTAKEGPGVFTVHWMQGMTHAPVAVVYGEKHGRTDIAVRGDTVVVAYEDPNTDPRRIGLALSTTGSHLFQYRSVVSPPTGAASDPFVQLEPQEILVAWTRTIRGHQERQMRRGRIR